MTRSEGAGAWASKMASTEVAKDWPGIPVPLFFTRDKKSVFITEDTEITDAAAHYVPEAISRVYTKNKQYLVRETEFDHVIGNTKVVKTTREDTVIWAQRIGKTGHSRHVINRRTEPCKSLTVILMQAKEDPNRYILKLAFIGIKRIKEPEEIKNLRRHRDIKNKFYHRLECVKFWQEHAYVFDKHDIVSGTILEYNPYIGENGEYLF